MSKRRQRPIAQNRRASHEYFIEETFEAGLVLKGTEIKSIRAGRVNIADAHVRIINGEAFVINMHIAPFEHGNRYNHDPTRTRKLLLHRDQIDKLFGLTQRQGYTIVPLRLYIKNGFAKLLIGLGKGKKLHDRREDLKQKQMKRDIDRAMRERQKG